METIQVKTGTKLSQVLKFAGTRKRKVFVSIVEPGLYETAPGWWDGGSQEKQVCVEVLCGSINVLSAHQITNPFEFRRAEGFPTVKVDDDQALLTVGTFCGKPRVPHIKCTQAYWEGLQWKL